MIEGINAEILTKFGILGAYLLQTIIFIVYIYNRDAQNNKSSEKSEARFEAIAQQSITIVQNNTEAIVNLNNTNKELRNDIQKLDKEIYDLQKKI